MIKNYFKLGLRNLAKHRLSSTINIVGLALAVGCSLVVFQFFNWSMHMDTFHHKLNNLYVVERIAEKDGQQQLWGNSPLPMGPMLKNDFPQIKNIARLTYTGAIIKQGDNVFREEVTFVDDSFYNMFDFPVKWGNKAHFTDPDGIVLTENLSKKLFGNVNSLGKVVNVRFNNDGKEIVQNFTVKGVFDKQPIESSFYFSSLVPQSKMISLGMDKAGDWKQTTHITFLEAGNEKDLSSVQNQTGKYVKLYNAANKDDKIVGFHFQALKTMNFHAWKVNWQRFAQTHIAGFIMLAVIAIATLLLVYFNYMNIAIASASTRLKEIGIRKTMGSSRKQIIFQFILENLILCTIAVILGLGLAKFFFIPWFEQIATIEFSKVMFANYSIWVALFLLIIISALSGAAYPSFYISSFKPVNIFKGNSKMGSKNRFRKSLLSFQFFLTFLATSVAIAFIQETKQIKARPWGYNPIDNVVVTLDKTANFDAFKNELENSGVGKSVTGSVQPLGNYTRQLIIKSEGREQTVQSISALPGFAKQLGISIAKGRDLSEEFKTDQTNTVLVNQAFLKLMGWKSAIGKNIEYDKQLYKVVGETSDFHFEDFNVPVGPIVLMGCKPADVNFVYVKTSSGIFSTAHADVEKIWKKINPNLPFEYHYQEGVFDQYFNAFSQVSQIMSAASLIMIVISISGIFGLALLILGKKMKEISIRKVLGAGAGTIIYLINKEFLFAILFAILFGFPMSWWITRSLYNQVAPDTVVSFTPLVLSLISLIVMTIVSVLWHIYKANTANPTQYLKDE